jgi:RNA polymerase sigma-70 factor (ECF subfamily)
MPNTFDYQADAPARGDFTTTHWSVVLAAGHSSSAGSQAALEKLCRTYWYPLYVYARRQGYNPDDAQDLTQDFFARLLRKDYFDHADPQRGRFRTFLLSSLKRFLINDWEKRHAIKRGGVQSFLVWDSKATESRYQNDPITDSTPETIYEKRWALALLDQAVARLKDEFSTDGKAAQFEGLKGLLWGEKAAPAYAEVAVELGLSVGALKVAVHRLRHRFRQLLRDEVAHTVGSPDQVDDELRHLIAVISN